MHGYIYISEQRHTINLKFISSLFINKNIENKFKGKIFPQTQHVTLSY